MSYSIRILRRAQKALARLPKRVVTVLDIGHRSDVYR